MTTTPEFAVRRGHFDAKAILYGLSLGLFAGRVLLEGALQIPPGARWMAVTLLCIVGGVLFTAVGSRRWRLSPLLLLLIYTLWPRLSPELAWTSVVVSVVALVHCNVPVRRAWVWDIPVLLLSLGLYAKTLAPTVLPADSGEFQFVSYVLGIAHPPGYPLYTMLGKLFTLLPFGDVAYRVNLFAAVTSALTLVVVSRTVRHSTQSPLAGWLAAAFLGAAPTFWSQGTTANIRSLTALFTAVQVFSCLEYARTREVRYLDLLTVAVGLGVTHHSSNVPLLLPYALFVLGCDPTLIRRPLAWRRPLALFALSLTVLLYLPVRSALGAPFDPQPIRTFAGFLEHVLALGFRGDMFYYVQPDALLSRAAVLLNILRIEFGIPLLGLMAAGAVLALRRQRPILLVCGGVFVVNAVLAMTYRAPQTVEYLMPGYVALACLGAAGVWALGQLPWALEWRTIALAAVLVLPLSMLQQSYSSFRQLSQDRSAREYAETILQQAPAGAQVLSNWHHATVFWYLQYVEKLRPDVEVTYVFPEGSTPNSDVWLRRVADSYPQRETILTNYYPEFASAPYVLQPFAGAFLVTTPALAARPAAAHRMAVSFDDLIQFVGYELDQREVSPTDALRLRMYWQPIIPLQRDYSFFVHLVNESGAILGQGDIHQPAAQYAPGQVALNEYEIPLLPTAHPGKYRLIAGVYFSLSEGGWQRLKTAQGDDSIVVAEVSVQPLSTAPVTSHSGLWPSDSGYTLLGVDYDHSVPGQLRVYLHWRSESSVRLPCQVALTSSQGVRVQSPLPQLPNGAYLTTVYDLPGGQHGLTVELAPGETGGPYAWRGPWWMATGNRLPLPDPAPHERYVPLGGEMVLVRAQYPASVGLGELLKTTMTLVGARPIWRDYSVSVSLRAESGEWQTQHDGTPAMGAIPTLKWIQGTLVQDEHSLPPAVGAVGRGMLRLTVYDAFTIRPLPVLDERLARAGQGTQIDLGTVEVRSP